MIRHAPADYVCPFCRNINEGGADHPLEMIRIYDDVVVKMNPKWWRANAGALLVVPKAHYENVYDLPVELGTPLQVAVRDAALALKDVYWPSAEEMRVMAHKVRSAWPT